MSKKWYLIANASEARIYSRNLDNDQLECLETLTHPESRMKGSELSSDRPGHYQSSGNGRGAFVEKTDPKEYEAERFAIEIGKFLNNERTQNKYVDLCISATPHFHGLINKHLDKQVSALVSKHADKDLMQIDESKLAETFASL